MWQGQDAGNRNPEDASKTYSFNSLPGNAVRKRQRRRFDENERLYACNFPACTKAYETLNHLNAHINMQKHGQKRHPNGESFASSFLSLSRRSSLSSHYCIILHCRTTGNRHLPRVTSIVCVSLLFNRVTRGRRSCFDVARTPFLLHYYLFHGVSIVFFC